MIYLKNIHKFHLSLLISNYFVPSITYFLLSRTKIELKLSSIKFFILLNIFSFCLSLPHSCLFLSLFLLSKFAKSFHCSCGSSRSLPHNLISNSKSLNSTSYYGDLYYQLIFPFLFAS